jgi:hypothetical protein
MKGFSVRGMAIPQRRDKLPSHRRQRVIPACHRGIFNINMYSSVFQGLETPTINAKLEYI